VLLQRTGRAEGMKARERLMLSRNDVFFSSAALAKWRIAFRLWPHSVLTGYLYCPSRLSGGGVTLCVLLRYRYIRVGSYLADRGWMKWIVRRLQIVRKRHYEAAKGITSTKAVGFTCNLGHFVRVVSNRMPTYQLRSSEDCPQRTVESRSPGQTEEIEAQV